MRERVHAFWTVFFFLIHFSNDTNSLVRVYKRFEQSKSTGERMKTIHNNNNELRNRIGTRARTRERENLWEEKHKLKCSITRALWVERHKNETRKQTNFQFDDNKWSCLSLYSFFLTLVMSSHILSSHFYAMIICDTKILISACHFKLRVTNKNQSKNNEICCNQKDAVFSTVIVPHAAVIAPPRKKK